MSAKVFCIGFHKTGTSSLGEALRLLGLSVRGAVDVHEAEVERRVDQIIARNVPRYDAFQDNPWPILFRELDQLCPGSKFILTWREPQDWLQSVLGHFGGTSTPMREWIYGHGDPVGHEVKYLERYLRHRDEVVEHFAGRDTDFTTLHIIAGEGWERICPFLGMGVPAGVPFPHRNRKAGRRGIAE